MKSYSNRGLHIKHCTANGLILQSSRKIWWVSGKDGECEQMSKCQLLTPFATQSLFFEWCVS